MKLKPIPGEKLIYTGAVHGEPAIVAFRRRNRTDEKYLRQTVVFNPKQIQRAKQLADKEGLACYVIAEVLLKGKWVGAWAVPVEKWPNFRQRKAEFPVTEKALEHSAIVSRGFEVEEDKAAKPEKKAVKKPEPKPAKKKHHGGSGAAAPAAITAQKVEGALKPELERLAESLPGPTATKVPEAPKPKVDLAFEIAKGLNTQHHPDSGPKEAPAPEAQPPKDSRWTPEDEAEINKYMAEGIERASAIRKMQRRKARREQLQLMNEQRA